jgi:ABC-type phosphate transport system, periplasmic component
LFYEIPQFYPQTPATVLLAGVSATASAQMLINGAGATFPYPIYSKWFDEYVKVDPSSGSIINPSDRAEAKNRSSRRRSISARPMGR